MILRKRQLILTRPLNTNAVNVYLSRLEFLFTLNSSIDNLKASGSQKLNVKCFHLNTTSHLCMPLGCLHTAQLRKHLHASKENLNPVKSCQLLRIIFFCVYVHKFLLLLPYPEYTITASLSWSIDPVLLLLFTQTDKMADYNSSNEWNFTAANN